MRVSDGKKILKGDAVPTMFSHREALSCRQPSKRFRPAADALMDETPSDHDYMGAHEAAPEDAVTDQDSASIKSEIHHLNYLLDKQKKRNDQLSSNLDKVFNADQREALER